MLKTIVMVTILTLDPAAAVSAWQEAFAYRTVAAGTVSPGLARSWSASAETGSDWVLLQPEGGDAVNVRFLRTDSAAGYAAMRNEGWSAIELLVQNADRMAAELPASGFQVAAGPAYLSASKTVRALQATGPSGELVYLSEIIDPARNSVATRKARTRVDSIFIVVAGTRDLNASRDFYRNRLGLRVSEVFGFRIEVLSRAWQLPDDTEHELALAYLAPGQAIELDRYPEAAEAAPATNDRLPGGVAMVSFLVDTLPARDLLATPGRDPAPPYNGRRHGVLRGPAGELLELIETRTSARSPGAIEGGGSSPDAT